MGWWVRRGELGWGRWCVGGVLGPPVAAFLFSITTALFTHFFKENQGCAAEIFTPELLNKYIPHTRLSCECFI